LAWAGFLDVGDSVGVTDSARRPSTSASTFAGRCSTKSESKMRSIVETHAICPMSPLGRALWCDIDGLNTK
jgi:hypothetical protein